MADEKIKIKEDSITKKRDCFFVNNPEGISRFSVLGFFASMLASTILLKPIAADRAHIIASMIQKKSLNKGVCFSQAIIVADNAKGSAKIV